MEAKHVRENVLFNCWQTTRIISPSNLIIQVICMLFPEVKSIVSKDAFLGKRKGKIHLRELYLPNINRKEWLPKK